MYSEYENQVYEIYKRNYLLNNIEKSIIIPKFNNLYNQHLYYYYFNIYWGLFLPEERQQFININIRNDEQRMP